MAEVLRKGYWKDLFIHQAGLPYRLFIICLSYYESFIWFCFWCKV